MRIARPPKFEDKYEEREYLKGQLAAAFRIFGKLGYDQGVAGHITLRDPVDPECFWVNPFGVPYVSTSEARTATDSEQLRSHQQKRSDPGRW